MSEQLLKLIALKELLMMTVTPSRGTTMPLVTCPSCQARINVPERSMGRWITCPKCKMQFAAVGDELAADDEVSVVDWPQPSTPPYILVGWIVTGLMAVVALVALGIVVSRKPVEAERQTVGKPGKKTERAGSERQDEPSARYESRNELQPEHVAIFGMSLATFVVLTVIGFMVYFIPVFIAFMRGHPNAAPIAVVTVFFGWTVIGYAVALAWSFTAIEKGKEYH